MRRIGWRDLALDRLAPGELSLASLVMARIGAGLSPELRARVPELFNTAYDPKTAVPRLPAKMNDPSFAPPPTPAARRAVIEEWQVGHPASMQHEIVVHPDGRVYSVDMGQDNLYRLDPASGEIKV